MADLIIDVHAHFLPRSVLDRSLFRDAQRKAMLSRTARAVFRQRVDRPLKG